MSTVKPKNCLNDINDEPAKSGSFYRDSTHIFGLIINSF